MSNKPFSISYFLVLIFLLLLFLSSVGRAHDFKDARMDQLEYLYARHDDDRLVKIACARALNGDAQGAFYLGAVLSEPESLYYRPKTAFLWLTIAKNSGYKIAHTFTYLVFPSLSKKEIEINARLAEQCKKSNFNDCLTSDSVSRLGSLGWPPQIKFICKKHKQMER